jgi:hypothetical protein
MERRRAGRARDFGGWYKCCTCICAERFTIAFSGCHVLRMCWAGKVDRVESIARACWKRYWNGVRACPRRSFYKAWEERLAFQGRMDPGIPRTQPREGWTSSRDMEGLPAPVNEGEIIGLAPDGSLRLRTRTGEVVIIHVGEVRLGPAG